MITLVKTKHAKRKKAGTTVVNQEDHRFVIQSNLGEMVPTHDNFAKRCRLWRVPHKESAQRLHSAQNFNALSEPSGKFKIVGRERHTTRRRQKGYYTDTYHRNLVYVPQTLRRGRILRRTAKTTSTVLAPRATTSPETSSRK